VTVERIMSAAFADDDHVAPIARENRSSASTAMVMQT
jgi:hypothetical protein